MKKDNLLKTHLTRYKNVQRNNDELLNGFKTMHHNCPKQIII